MNYQICLLQMCFYSSQPSWVSINTLTECANLTPVSRLFWWRVYEQHHLQNTILVYGCVENKVKGRYCTHVSNVSKSYRLCRETTQTMTNLSELSWAVSLAYLICRDDKTVTSEASGNLPGIHNLVKVPWTHWIFFFVPKESNLEGKRQSLGSSFHREPVADSSDRHPNNMADDECESLRLRICANACLRVTVLRANVGGESRRSDAE